MRYDYLQEGRTPMLRKLTALLLVGAACAAFMLGFFGKLSVAQTRTPATLANPLEQRAEMIQELRAIRALLREQNDLIREQVQLLRKLAAAEAKDTTK